MYCVHARKRASGAPEHTLEHVRKSQNFLGVSQTLCPQNPLPLTLDCAVAPSLIWVPSVVKQALGSKLKQPDLYNVCI